MVSTTTPRPSSAAPEPEPLESQAIATFNKYGVSSRGLRKMAEENPRSFHMYLRVILNMDSGTLDQDANFDGAMTSGAELHTRIQGEGHAIQASSNKRKRDEDEDNSEPGLCIDTANKKRVVSPPVDFCTPVKCKTTRPYTSKYWFVQHCDNVHSEILGGTVDDLKRAVVFVCSTCRENRKELFSFPNRKEYLHHHLDAHYPAFTVKGPSSASPTAIGPSKQNSKLHSNGHTGQTFSPMLDPVRPRSTNAENSSYQPAYQPTACLPASTPTYGQPMPMPPTISGYPMNGCSRQPSGFAPLTANNFQTGESYQQAPHQTPRLLPPFTSSSTPQPSIRNQAPTLINHQPQLGNQQSQFFQNSHAFSFPPSQIMPDTSLPINRGLQPINLTIATPYTSDALYEPPQNHST